MLKYGLIQKRANLLLLQSSKAKKTFSPLTEGSAPRRHCGQTARLHYRLTIPHSPYFCLLGFEILATALTTNISNDSHMRPTFHSNTLILLTEHFLHSLYKAVWIKLHLIIRSRHARNSTTEQNMHYIVDTAADQTALNTQRQHNILH